MFALQAYVNFVKNKLSKFSYDTFSLFLATRINSKKELKRIKALQEDTKIIRRFGVYALLGFVGSVYAIVKVLNGH
jgi:hypothetical protein